MRADMPQRCHDSEYILLGLSPGLACAHDVLDQSPGLACAHHPSITTLLPGLVSE